MKKHRIAALTSSRADFSVLYWLLQAIENDPDCDLLLYVTGTHLSAAFGNTVDEIRKSGLPVAKEIAILPTNETMPDPASAMARVLDLFAPSLSQLRPDLLIVLGDRYEIVPVALAAVLQQIPVCHIHGGEISEGALDEYFRHAVTKLSVLHFPATETYRQRIIQMGEDPRNVINHGAPALDHLSKTPLLDKLALEKTLDFSLNSPIALMTYHPVTTEPGTARWHAEAVLQAILETDNLRAIVTKANADAEGGEVNALVTHYCEQYPDRLKLFDNLGSQRYFSCLAQLDLLVGNTSSGLIEAPSFACPVVNVGNRQKGRMMAPNVLSTSNSKQDIRAGIRRALSVEFRESLQGMKNPYDRHADGRVSDRILESIKNYVRSNPSSAKSFIDLTDRTVNCV